jgi:hypothetical protein
MPEKPPLPFDAEYPEELHVPLARAVGEIVLSWGTAEALLSHWVVIIYQKGGGEHVQSKIPIMFGQKIEFLRKCFNQLAPLKPYASAALPLLESAAKIAGIRNSIIHGYVSNYDHVTGRLTFTKLDPDKETKTAIIDNSFSATIANLQHFAGRCSQLATALAEGSFEIFEAF